MKAKALLIAGSGLLLAATGLLLTDSSPAPATAPVSMPTKKRDRPARHQVAQAATKAPRAESDEEAANLSAWTNRFEALLAESGDREEALKVLLQEIDATYRNWVAGQLTPVTELPPGERYDELADIERTVTEGMAAILEQLGLEERQRMAVAAGPAEVIAAEVQYAEAARDSDSRLALLRLDRERQARMEGALAHGDETAKVQAIAELDAWYEAGLGRIFATDETE